MKGEDFERRRELIRQFRNENGRDPDDTEWLEIYAQVKRETKRKDPRLCLGTYEVAGVRKVLYPEDL